MVNWFPFNALSSPSLSLEALSWPANRQAGPVREFPKADLWCQDLHLNPALHPEHPDLPHRRSVAATACALIFLPEMQEKGNV